MSRNNTSQYSNRYFSSTEAAAAAVVYSATTAAAANNKSSSSSSLTGIHIPAVIHTATVDYSRLDGILEEEKVASRKESWNKIEKGLKMQKLHAFAEKYANENELPLKEVNSLKTFFGDCLQKGKLCKAKDVVYDKITGTVTQVPALGIHGATRVFTLRNMDKSRISTLKSLTPKRSYSEMNNSNCNLNDVSATES